MICLFLDLDTTYDLFSHNIHPDSVLVTIMDGEGKSAAVHRDETSAAPPSDQYSPVLTLVIVIILRFRISETNMFCSL